MTTFTLMDIYWAGFAGAVSGVLIMVALTAFGAWTISWIGEKCGR